MIRPLPFCIILVIAIVLFLQPSSAAANRYNSRWPFRQNRNIRMSAVNGTGKILTNFPVLINSSDTNPKSGQVQPVGNDLFNGPSDLNGVVDIGMTIQKELS